MTDDNDDIKAEIVQLDNRWFLVMSRTIHNHGEVKALTDITDIYQSGAEALRPLFAIASEEVAKARQEAVEQARAVHNPPSPVQFYFKAAVNCIENGRWKLAEDFLDKMYGEIVLCPGEDTFEQMRAWRSACKQLKEARTDKAKYN